MGGGGDTTSSLNSTNNGTSSANGSGGGTITRGTSSSGGGGTNATVQEFPAPLTPENTVASAIRQYGANRVSLSNTVGMNFVLKAGTTNDYTLTTVTNEQATLTIYPADSREFYYVMQYERNGEKTDFGRQAGSRYSKNRGSSNDKISVASWDGKWHEILKATPAGKTKYVRRFQEENEYRRFNESTSSFETGIEYRFGVFGLKTPANAVPTTGNKVEFNGQLAGEIHNAFGSNSRRYFTRPATFIMDFGSSAISAEFGVTKYESSSGTGTSKIRAFGGTISGNGFTIPNLASTETGTSFENVAISGNFYGNAAQELGGTVSYVEKRVAGNSTRTVGGAFSAIRAAE